MSIPEPTWPYRASRAGGGLGTLGVLECPERRHFGDAFLGLAEPVDKRSSRVLDHLIDHCLVVGRRVAKGLLGGSSLLGEVHHCSVMIGRRVGTQLSRPSANWRRRGDVLG